VSRPIELGGLAESLSEAYGHGESRYHLGFADGVTFGDVSESIVRIIREVDEFGRGMSFYDYSPNHIWEKDKVTLSEEVVDGFAGYFRRKGLLNPGETLEPFGFFSREENDLDSGYVYPVIAMVIMVPDFEDVPTRHFVAVEMDDAREFLKKEN
jgi:hypothetical protein